MSDCKRVYRFGTDAQGTCVTEGDKSMNFVLGGKGANLAEMSRIGLPVPGGFTITCQPCVEYSGAGNDWPEDALDEIVAAEADLEARCGKKLGDANDPLLVSVRSGAPFSMPGMMDTVLNLGLITIPSRASSRRRRTRVLPGIATAALSRCFPMSSWALTPTCSRTP